MSDKKDQFDNIWDKDNRMKQKILAWLAVRKIERTYENALAYWMGNIKPFKDPRQGETIHLNTKTDWRMVNRIRRWGTNGEKKGKRKGRNNVSHRVSRHNRRKN
jgi:hypothetical protein